MPRFKVYMDVTYRQQKPITVYADDEAEAEEKAVEICTGWDNVREAEPYKTEED